MTELPEGEGDCFRVALHVAEELARTEPVVYVVHGEVTGQGPVAGVRFAHAWVETEAAAIDRSNGMDDSPPIPKPLYYAVGQIEDPTRYTLTEARLQAVRSGHYGPWEVSNV
jgi:hypothetical protein